MVAGFDWNVWLINLKICSNCGVYSMHKICEVTLPAVVFWTIHAVISVKRNVDCEISWRRTNDLQIISRNERSVFWSLQNSRTFSKSIVLTVHHDSIFQLKTNVRSNIGSENSCLIFRSTRNIFSYTFSLFYAVCMNLKNQKFKSEAATTARFCSTIIASLMWESLNQNQVLRFEEVCSRFSRSD